MIVKHNSTIESELTSEFAPAGIPLIQRMDLNLHLSGTQLGFSGDPRTYSYAAHKLQWPAQPFLPALFYRAIAWPEFRRPNSVDLWRLLARWNLEEGAEKK